MSSNVVVVGRESQLGKTLQLIKPHWQYLSRTDLDLTQVNTIKNVLRKRPQILINFAAFTGVDLAEKMRDESMLINATAVGELAKYCDNFIHISTDYVFSGAKQISYTETDPTEPANFYGSTKLCGERLAIENNSQTFVFRTSWLYSEYNVNFVKRILELGRRNEKSGEPLQKGLRVVNDQRGTPTYAFDLVQTIVMAVDKLSVFAPGIYHFSNEGECSWFEFTKEIFRLKNVHTQVCPITTEEYPTPAKRPHYSVLNKAKIKSALGIHVPHWQESLSTFLKGHL